MSSIVYISDHADRAEARLPSQYQNQPKLASLVRASGDQAQAIEDVMEDILDHSSVANAHDFLLDQIGDIVGIKRDARTDTVYKGYLYAKIAQNISRGTPEVIISLFKFLMGAERVYYNPIYPAGFSLTAIGSLPFGSTPAVPFSFSDDTDPAGEGFGDYNDAALGGDFASAAGFTEGVITIIKAALNSARLAGVSIDYFATALPGAFSFSDDPDLEGLGFGDDGDSSVGGLLAEVI